MILVQVKNKETQQITNQATFATRAEVDAWIAQCVAATNITATVNLLTEKVNPMFDYVRAYFTMTAGQISISQITSVKGE